MPSSIVEITVRSLSVAALDKLGFRHVLSQGAVEPVQLNVAFDIASLVLYGCQALPIRLKILLDRLFSVLQRDEVVQVLRGFGWTQEDYARGYILQEPHGAVLDRWNICSPEEEPLVLQQFLRFGETRAITQQLLLHGVGDGRFQSRVEADLKKALERNSAATAAAAAALAAHQRKEDDQRRSSSALSPPSSARPPVSSPQQQPSAGKPPSASLNFKLPPTGLICTPATSAPPVSSPPAPSPITVSPLNKLQNMQPFDFRKMVGGKASPERRRLSEDTLMNLSVTSSSNVHLPPPPPAASATSQPQPMMLGGHKSPSIDYYPGSSEFGSEDDEDVDENSQSVLNLSRDSPGFASKQHRQQPQQHQARKSHAPVKRQWGSSSLPLNLGTQLINPATGKKRVQCNVCLKTFCDKGALKIHYSAVHLREMHRCTVEGCNMMFSSRRSRNRHSANPNPKLHSPHLRRKISPHDGRSSLNHPILIPPLGLNPLSFGPFPLLTPPPEHMRHQAAAALDLKQSLDLSSSLAARHHDKSRSGTECSDQMEDYIVYDDDDDDEDGIVVEGDDDDGRDSVTHNGDKHHDSADDCPNDAKRYKLSESEGDMEDDNEDSNEDSLSVVDSHEAKDDNATMTAENLVTRTSRKRKNQNPTRFTVAQRIVQSEAASDDDSSTNLVYQSSSSTKEKRLNEDEKVEDMSVRSKPDESPHENNNNIRIKNVDEQKMMLSKFDDKEPADLSCHDTRNEDEPENLKVSRSAIKEEKADVEEDNKSTTGQKNVKGSAISVNSNGDGRTEDIDSSNALRRLESLSQGHFGDLSRNSSITAAEAMHFAFMGDPPSPARSNGSSNGDSSNGDSDPENQVYGHFQDGTFITTTDVPIDKDNPRMCTACGKVFQNHFGVKTHYQNVHLKLMHKCTVDGCNAAFPSKRSRDRHSANLNLHRKLLSTSLTDKSGLFLDPQHLQNLTNHSLHPEFLARLYADTQALGGHLLSPPPPPGLLNGDRLPPPMFPYPLGLAGFRGLPPPPPSPLMNGHSSGSESPRSPSSPGHSQLLVAESDEDAIADDDGRLRCRYCSVSCEDRSSLKDHHQARHTSEMFSCTVSDCRLVFLSRKKRDMHAEDEAAHSHKPRSSS
ncbi:ZnF_C2H2 [Nesidiocoris tenuis]|uniref:ZnF_C2H2 n=1 Tax=Nesidiocoris tenuis TaxID=355587 RepID=A0ABN7AQF0_9HEMI|nr:ZnF_C2H2 [Nesidiocoris tenuis]